jgi:class 3 adenylate cyclase/pimeloyl-ACP methyl ester carboxylesterase
MATVRGEVVKPPRTQFADSPEGKIAYQVVGEGPIDLLYCPSPTFNLDFAWEQPPIERYLRRLASFSRLIIFNPRGTGSSDPIPTDAPPALEEWIIDIKYVLDAAGSESAACLTSDWQGPPAMIWAATFPDRVRALVFIDAFATARQYDDYPWGLPSENLEQYAESYVEQWGTGELARLVAPELAADPGYVEWFAKLQRMSATPATMNAVKETVLKIDVRSVLPAIKAPTLVIAHPAGVVPEGHGRYLADHIPNARYVERPGFWGIPWVHDVEGTLEEVETFLTGAKGTADLDDRVLATIMFTDIVGSTKRAAELGDKRWRQLMDEHDALMQRELGRFRGRQVKSTGDGVLATFDGPARAIRCALAVQDAAKSLGVEICAGIHTGEVEMRDQDMGGIGVNIAARVMASAGPGEVLVSTSVPPLVAGSGIEFEDRGVHDLKGVPGEWRLFAVARESLGV